MAIATIKITCKTCGKEFTHRRDCRNRADAESYKSWAVDHIDTCPECYAAAQKAAEEERVSKQAAELGLPELVGTEKQIAWAKRIRSERINESARFGITVERVRQIIAEGKEEELLAAIKQSRNANYAKSALFSHKAITENSAKWWIENQ